MTRACLAFCVLALTYLTLLAQTPAPTLNFETKDFTLKLVKASQTVAALQPKGAGGFDFTPADRLANRAADRFNSIGDLTFRARVGTSGPWQDFSTSAARHPVEALPVEAGVLAAANLATTLSENCPVQVTRRWLLDDGHLVLQFDLKNNGATPVQIGALGMPMIFNNMLTGRQLSQMEEVNSFYDPAINEDGGYVKVDGDWVRVATLDAFRQRVYIAPRGLWLTLDAGTFDSVEINSRTHAVRVGLSPVNTATPQARLRIEQPAKVAGVGKYHPAETFQNERDAFVIPLQTRTRWLNLTD